jgi:hypothetical protein
VGASIGVRSDGKVVASIGGSLFFLSARVGVTMDVDPRAGSQDSPGNPGAHAAYEMRKAVTAPWHATERGLGAVNDLLGDPF